jgi:hypothetical protein
VAEFHRLSFVLRITVTVPSFITYHYPPQKSPHLLFKYPEFLSAIISSVNFHGPTWHDIFGIQEGW